MLYRICEAMELNPVPVLISIVIFSNIGGRCPDDDAMQLSL